MRGFTVLLAIACVVSRGSARAQVPAAATAMLQKIFASRDFNGDRFGPARWIENGDAYTTVEPSRDGAGRLGYHPVYDRYRSARSDGQGRTTGAVRCDSAA